MASSERPTIGIMTALPVEHAAVAYVVDGFRSVPSPDPADRADYMIGTLPSLDPARPHRIVATSLVVDGGVSAANACANLQRTWGLSEIVMCGIACGVPVADKPDRHVRLGDVLVADEGVIPYGHLRVLRDRTELRRHVARPSVNLKRAANRLKLLSEQGRRPWNRVLDELRRSLPPEYQRPETRTDVLYRDDRSDERVPHPAQRQRRPGYPLVHYGLLGGGDWLMRRAAERDRLARRYGLIGFEMEGHGISDSAYLQGANWFMVRGTADYGDTHKNDQWHRYGSVSAAAYTRALLANLAPLSAAPTAERAAAPAAVAPALVDDLVDALLQTSELVSPRRRDALVAELPAEVRHLIPRNRSVREDLTGIVRLMAAQPAGLDAVVRAANNVVSDVSVLRRLRELMYE
jgi:nucleoside phosphorylase